MLDRMKREIEMAERHMNVLEHVQSDGPIGIVKLSKRTDYAHHKVRYTLRVLEEEGLVEPTNSGAVALKETEEFIEDMNGDIDDLVEMLRKMKIDNGV